MSLDDELMLAYAADEHEFRRKTCGLSLTDQLLLSVSSVRDNWSTSIEIVVSHTTPLAASTLDALAGLRVRTVHAARTPFSSFPLANKLLVGDLDSRGKDLLFLDCDTIVHAPVAFDRRDDLIVALDALRAVPENVYREFLSFLGLAMPAAPILEAPAFEYYMHATTHQFPQLNSGVFYIRNRHARRFFDAWETLFHRAHQRFAHEKWAFYLEQLAFIAAMLRERIRVGLFVPGINFICTPRAPHLREWPRSQIVIEHYAGDTSRPLVFAGDRIDVAASHLAPPGSGRG